MVQAREAIAGGVVRFQHIHSEENLGADLLSKTLLGIQICWCDLLCSMYHVISRSCIHEEHFANHATHTAHTQLLTIGQLKKI